MDKFDRIEIDAGYRLSVMGIFERLGEIEAEAEIDENLGSSANQILKTTSVRLPEDKILIMDAVASAFGMSRNTLISYAISQFIADSLTGYAVGKSKVLTCPSSSTFSYAENAHEHFKDLINSLPLSDELRLKVYEMFKHDFFVSVGIEPE